MALIPGLLAVHAHPDDEVISTGGVLARAVAAGRRVKVLTCTDGSRGEVVGEGMDAQEVFPRLAEVRRGELADALGVLGVAEHEFLGYADSGMMGTEGNRDPASFWRADLHEAIGRVVRVIRVFKPSVLVTYDAYGGYGHPDHIQVHRVSVLAAEAASVGALYPEAGEPWHIPKVYLSTIPKSRIAQVNRIFVEIGLPSPFGEATDPAEISMGTPDERVTTVVDVRDQIERKLRALQAHRSQIAPESFFLNVPEEMGEAFYGVESFACLRADVAGTPPEADLFAGL